MIWKPIKEQLDYEVSNMGEVRNDKKILLTPSVYKKGYYHVTLPGHRIRYVHRLVYQAFKGPLIKGKVVDHIDGNKLNNCADNLQQVTNRHNVSKGYKGKGTSSNYVGVSWYKRDRKWEARIRVGKRQIFLGKFTSQLDAYKAYNKALNKIQKR